MRLLLETAFIQLLQITTNSPQIKIRNSSGYVNNIFHHLEHPLKTLSKTRLSATTEYMHHVFESLYGLYLLLFSRQFTYFECIEYWDIRGKLHRLGGQVIRYGKIIICAQHVEKVEQECMFIQVVGAPSVVQLTGKRLPKKIILRKSFHKLRKMYICFANLI